MYIDEANIKIKSGDGGNGAVSLRHEKYVPKGGPDGGDGGDGGNIIFKADQSIHGLDSFKGKNEYFAQNGKNGGKAKKHGANGKDLILKVPPGTVIVEQPTKRTLCDLKSNGNEYIALKGGRGGIGNAKLAKPDLQTPMFSQSGEKGREKEIYLEIRYIADVGIIGLPNAGKSTFISTVTNARPQIANYPFTSLGVTLGRLDYNDQTIILADIPGLIEGSSLGKGLGVRFLKHILRTRLLVHLISADSNNYYQDYLNIRRELENFNTNLTKKEEIIAISKSEIIEKSDLLKKTKELKKNTGKEIYNISSATHWGIEELLSTMCAALDKINR